MKNTKDDKMKDFENNDYTERVTFRDELDQYEEDKIHAFIKLETPMGIDGIIIQTCEDYIRFEEHSSSVIINIPIEKILYIKPFESIVDATKDMH